MRIGIVGLGRMGMNIAKRLLRHGHEVVAYNRTPSKTEALQEEGATATYSLKELVSKLDPPRLVWLMLPAGRVTGEHIEILSGLLSRGDIIIDGANSHYRDSISRAEILHQQGIHFLDIGVSGGIWGLEEGFCLMIGGDYEVYRKIIPVFESLASEGGFLYCGSSGAGHYVKMIHNGIEYALMEAYAEGFEILRNSPYQKELNLADIAGVWMRGSVIRSWLLELIERILRKDPELREIKAYVEDSGEGRWTVTEALDIEVPVSTIALSLFKRFRSRQEEPFSEKVLAALRAEFGGHRVIKKEET